ncbi:acyltransferase domain-containing protein [Cystoisospora suis]|uniref:Acyltransferase domain-containing protein n=1 Tax=Cystoisospora suis TaxID=483139 RepID=A0A2C6KEU5_9APIC|nr:acyltransferase domain-containing protein [Cystoisospora suis]
MKESSEALEGPSLLDAPLPASGSHVPFRVVALVALLFYVGSCCMMAVLSLRRAKLYNNWDVLTSDEKRKFAAFERNDRKRLGLVRTALGGLFLLPWRMPLAFFLVISNGICISLLGWWFGRRVQTVSSEQKREQHRRFVWWCTSLHCRALLYVMVCVSEHRECSNAEVVQEITDDSPVFTLARSERPPAQVVKPRNACRCSYLPQGTRVDSALSVGILQIREHYLANKDHPDKKPAGQPRILVSNHVSCLDIPYFIITSFAAFVSKSSLSTTPFIGIAANNLGCIYVDRESNDDRAAALEKIKERQYQCCTDPHTNALVIFPEGTTTNGRCLLQFRRGGFSAFCRVQPVLLVYRCGYFDLAFELLPSFDWMVLSLSSVGLTRLDAYWLNPVDPPPPEKYQSVEERATAFANLVSARADVDGDAEAKSVGPQVAKMQRWCRQS